MCHCLKKKNKEYIILDNYTWQSEFSVYFSCQFTMS